MQYRIVATSDVHGNLFSRSFADGSETPYGAARLSSYLRETRANSEQLLYIDNGDTLQGTPLVTYLAKTKGRQIMAELWRELGVDLVNLGNHDFNFGPQALQEFLHALPCPSICCNVRYQGKTLGQPQIVEFAGYKLGIIGVVTEYIPHWEAPANLEGIEILPVLPVLREWVAQTATQVDHIVVVYHGGLEADPATGRATEPATGENVGYQICTELPQVDLLLSGHQHRSFVARVGDTLVTQCHDKAAECVEVTFDPEAQPHQRFTARIVNLAEYPIDRELEAKFESVWEETQQWLDTRIGQATWGDCRVSDFIAAQREKHPFATLVNQAQLAVSGADISAASLFEVMPGMTADLSYRDVYLNYPFPNTMVVKRITGQTLLEYLQQLGQYWVLQEGQITVAQRFLKPKRELYNYDMLDGVEYTFVVAADGTTVRDVTVHGKPLDLEREYTIALSNYRAAGGGNFRMLAEAPVVGEDSRDLAEILIEYIGHEVAAHATLSVPQENNIHLVAAAV